VALAAICQIESIRGVGERAREGLLVIAHLLPDGVGELVVALGTEPDLHQARRIFDGQRAQHDGVEDAEDGGVCADTQRQRQQSCRRESRASRNTVHLTILSRVVKSRRRVRWRLRGRRL